MNDVAVLVAPAVVLFVLAFVSGSWHTGLIPLVVWPVFFVGLHEGWWGNGLGDNWLLGFLMSVAATTLAAVAGVLARRAAERVGVIGSG